MRAAELTPREHLVMQAAVQAHVDSSISKTINCPEDISFEAFKDIYREAYALGLKGCTTFRPNPVTGAVLHAGRPQPAPSPAHAASAPSQLEKPRAAGRLPAPEPARQGDVVYMSKPLERDAVLAGYTYKLKWPESEHAIYVTINDIESCRDGRQAPPAFEIFINTKNLEHYAWTVALTRMISAVFRRGGDVTFVAEELKAVFDPAGRPLDGRALRAEPAGRHRPGHRGPHGPHRLLRARATVPPEPIAPQIRAMVRLVARPASAARRRPLLPALLVAELRPRRGLLGVPDAADSPAAARRGLAGACIPVNEVTDF